MAKDDSRYSGNFFTSYTNTRMKLYRHCVPLDNDPVKISKIYGYDLAEVNRIFSELEQDMKWAVEKLQEKYGALLDSTLAGKKQSLVFIGDQLTSEYLSYYNIVKTLLKKYDNISVNIAGNTGDTSNQSVQYMYNLAISQEPTVTSILIGTNDLYTSKDAFSAPVASRDEYQENVDYMVKVLLHNSSAVILNTLPPVDTEAFEQAYSHMNWTIPCGEVEARNNILREIAVANGCCLNDVAHDFDNLDVPVTIPGNGVLLTKEAQLRLAEMYLDELLKIVK